MAAAALRFGCAFDPSVERGGDSLAVGERRTTRHDPLGPKRTEHAGRAAGSMRGQSNHASQACLRRNTPEGQGLTPRRGPGRRCSPPACA
jgi:hypothetical protein